MSSTEDNKLELEKIFFKKPMFYMKILGVNPYLKRTIPIIILVVFNIFSIFTGSIMEITFSVLNIKEVIKALDSFGPSIVKLVTTGKLGYLFSKRKDFIEIIAQCKGLFFADNPFSNDKKIFEIKMRYAKLATTFSLLAFWLAHFTNIGFSLRPSILMLKDYFSGNPIEKMMPFNA